MSSRESMRPFDVVVVGSGPGGAATARELAARGMRVLILERGRNRPPKDSLLALAAVSDYARIGDEVGFARALTTGGTTALYFGVAEFPPLQAFQALGLDLTAVVEQARGELPMSTPPDDRLLSAQVLRVRDSARELGIPWTKTEAMLIDASKCGHGPRAGAIWRAKAYVDEAVKRGVTLVNRATVRKVLVSGRRAVGVEYDLRIGRRRETHRAYGERIVLAAGALASPVILRESGVRVGEHGFYCDPGYLLTAHVKGLRGGELFAGSMGTNTDEDGILVGDGCLPRTMYRGYMASQARFRRLWSHGRSIGIGIMVRDGRGGGIRENGRFHKDFTREETLKLSKAEDLARKIIRHAGGIEVERSEMSAAHLGGLASIGEYVSADLETECERLHVCDCSVIPEHIRLTPTFTLVCLGKYLAHRLQSLN